VTAHCLKFAVLLQLLCICAIAQESAAMHLHGTVTDSQSHLPYLVSELAPLAGARVETTKPMRKGNSIYHSSREYSLDNELCYAFKRMGMNLVAKG